MSVSVIVATYGEESWRWLALDRAYPSVIHGDNTQVIAYHDPFGDITVRNDAAVDATGEWLCFLDADDELAPGYIAAMEAAIEKAEDWRCSGCNGMRSALCGDCEAANRDRAERTLFTPAVQIVRPNRTPGPPTFFRTVPLRQANWLVVGTLIHRDLFWEVGGFDDYPHGLEDWALWSKCARVGATVVKVPDAVYRYWANPDSMHRKLWRDKKVQRAAHARVAAELDEWEKARV